MHYLFTFFLKMSNCHISNYKYYFIVFINIYLLFRLSCLTHLYLSCKLRFIRKALSFKQATVSFNGIKGITCYTIIIILYSTSNELLIQ